MAVGLPESERARLRELYAYAVLDSDPEERFDQLVHVAAVVCGTQDARINFIDVDRQWTKAQVGDGGVECSRADSFCAHTIAGSGELLVVEDTRQDPRFSGNRFVTRHPFTRFYAGVPLVTPGGHAIGSLCVFDSTPQRLTAAQASALRALANQVLAQLDLRKLLAQERSTAEELRELNRLRNDLVNLVTHEFRNPLTAILGFADLLKLEQLGSLSQEQTRAVEAIDESSSRLVELVDELLATASAAEGDIEVAPTDLAPIVRAAVERARGAAQENRVALTVEAPAALPLRGDERRLAQVVDNLVSNAVKYTPAGGAVSVRAFGALEGAVIEVSDNGIGIPEDELPMLFTHFFRASTAKAAGVRGTGLGLAVVKTLVERHRGAVQVESKAGVGTTFRVELPYDPLTPEAAAGTA